MEIWGMAATSLAEPRRPEPLLDWRLIRDARTSIDIGLINAAAYGLPEEQFAVSHNLYDWSGECSGIVGWVATLPDRHGQGLGEAAMRLDPTP